MTSGGPSGKKPPSKVIATPASPRKTDQVVAKAEETELKRQKRMSGYNQTQLFTGGITSATVQRTTLLGGGQ